MEFYSRALLRAGGQVVFGKLSRSRLISASFFMIFLFAVKAATVLLRAQTSWLSLGCTSVTKRGRAAWHSFFFFCGLSLCGRWFGVLHGRIESTTSGSSSPSIGLISLSRLLPFLYQRGLFFLAPRLRNGGDWPCASSGHALDFICSWSNLVSDAETGCHHSFLSSFRERAFYQGSVAGTQR